MTNQQILDALGRHVADATVLTQRLRAFHWMVTGHQFFQLHAFFEKEYDRWTDAADELAERAIALGGAPPLTLAEMLGRASFEEVPGTLASREMVARYVTDLEAMRDGFRKTLALAEEGGDRTTANLLDGQLDGIEKSLWMLRAWLAS